MSGFYEPYLCIFAFVDCTPLWFSLDVQLEELNAVIRGLIGFELLSPTCYTCAFLAPLFHWLSR